MNVQKSPDAFRTISEVAMDLDVPQHVLRFWETKFTQIKPLKRGGGRRYYRPEDVDLLRGIRTLLYHDGYTIKGVQKVFREQGVRHVSEIGREEYAAELAEAEAAGEITEPAIEEDVAPAPEPAQHVAPAPFPPVPLTEDQQIELELLLEELEGLKAKLENARAATWF
ncbi:MerR family transcriptional regulator [Candidatus Phaeomarinobacter ectocarpi]|nr:MerR family transcriptional regulator [Candidatus Phaeomarinobacter ectocarpi]